MSKSALLLKCLVFSLFLVLGMFIWFYPLFFSFILGFITYFIIITYFGIGILIGGIIGSVIGWHLPINTPSIMVGHSFSSVIGWYIGMIIGVIFFQFLIFYLRNIISHGFNSVYLSYAYARINMKIGSTYAELGEYKADYIEEGIRNFPLYVLRNPFFILNILI